LVATVPPLRSPARKKRGEEKPGCSGRDDRVEEGGDSAASEWQAGKKEWEPV